MKIGSTSLRTIGSVTPSLAHGIGNIQADEVLLTTFFFKKAKVRQMLD
jgi:hypothetical protein